MSKSVQTRKCLSLRQKLEVLTDLHGMTGREVAVKWGISPAQVTAIKKNKEKIKDMSESSNLSRKRSRLSPQEDIGEALHIWFKDKVAQGARISGPILQEKARQLSEEKGLDPKAFVASQGWLTKWKARYQIVFKKEQGERASADVEGAKEWSKEVLPGILNTFSPEDLYNCDESGLYIRAFPDRGFVGRGDELPGGKKAKARVTALLCANMDGSDKKKLLIIGSAKRPRHFPRDLSTLPVDYVNSKKAWMNSSIFLDWLKKWDRQLIG